MNEPVRILHIITRMVRGGAQENTLGSVTRIHGEGWESVLVTGHAVGPEGSLEPECLASGVRMIHARNLVRELSPKQDFRALQDLKAILRKHRPHLVHTHTSKAGILGRIAAKSCGVPVVIHTPHGHVFHSYESRVKTDLFIRAERWCASRANRLIALTENEKREHLELGIGTPEQWTVIHSGVDFRPFESARGERERVRAELGMSREHSVVGTVGRLVPIKGQRYLLEAYALVAAKRPGVELLLVGDGELREELVGQALALKLGVIQHDRRTQAGPESPRVHFTGLRGDVPRLISAMDVFALPSLNEGMGRVLVEAMAMGLPCVASSVSGIPDVVEHGVTGLLHPPKDAPAIARALGELVDTPERAREMGRRGQARAVPGFSVENMVQRLENLYREELARKGIAAPSPRTVGKAVS